MSWLPEGWRRLARLTRRADIERRLDMELRFHIEQQTEKHVRAGVNPAEAHRQALMKFGGIDVIKEGTRDQFRVPFLEDVWRDLRQCVRALLSAPGFLAASTLTLALGIGANAAVFAVFNSVLLKPLAYPHADELVAVWNRAPGAPSFADVSDGLRLSLSMYVTYAEENRTFAHFGVWGTGTAALTNVGDPEQVRTVFATDGTLQTFGVPPRLGRWLSAEDQKPGSAATVMLTYEYWQRRFTGNVGALGQIITIDNIPRQIIGVMPRGFKFPTVDADVILPIVVDRSRLIRPGFAFFGVARLKPGATIVDANADIARMFPSWLHGWPGGGTQFYESMRITPALRPLKDDVIGNMKRALWLVLGTIAIVLLIACTNVTSLLLVRAEARQPETAVRAALGAPAWRLTAERLLESVLLSVVGGLFGLGVASAALRVLVAIGPAGLPRLDEISLDGRVLQFTLLVSLLSGMLVGLVPALKSPRGHIAALMYGATRIVGTSREHHRALNTLVVAQIALAVVLLVCSGLMIRTFQALRSVDPGFTDPEQLEIMHITVPPLLIPEREKVLRLQNDLVDKLSAIPGVRSASLISSMPIERIPTNWDAIAVEDRPTSPGDTPPLRPFKYVWPGIFRTIGTPLLAGRDFTWNDIYSLRPVVMISARLAREIWGTPSSAVGRRIRAGPSSQWRDIVGVVDDVRENGVDAPAPAIVYWPPLLDSNVPGINVVRTATFVVRSSGAGTDVLRKQIQEAVWSVNSNLPVAAEETMADVYQRSLAKTTFTLIILAIAGAMALAVGFIGIYGVIAYTITQRRREIGIRLALGAQRTEVQRRFVMHGLVVSGTGLVLGVGVSAILTRLMTSLLFDVSPLDPSTYIGVVLLVVAAAAGASYLPARRASRSEPRVAVQEGH